MKRRTLMDEWFSRRFEHGFPEYWRLARFGEVVANSAYGLGGDTGEIGPYPFLKMGNIVDGEILLADVDFCHVSGSDLKSARLRRGELLFNRTNSAELVGKAGVWDSDEIAFAASYIVRFAISIAANPDYLRHWWTLAAPRHRLTALATPGVQQVNINPTELQRAFYVALPPRAEQDAICQTIAHLDASFAATKRLLNATHRRRQALLQQLLTGKRRLAGFGPTQSQINTAYGALPADWTFRAIGEFSDQSGERNAANAALPVLSCTKSRGLVDSLSYFDRQVFSDDLTTYRLVRRGQFAYATNHIEEGSIGYQDLYDTAVISPMYTVFDADSTAVNHRYLYLQLKTEKYRRIFAANTNSSVDRRGGLRWDDFARIQVPVPTPAEQAAIVAVAETADRELALLERLLQAYRRQKRGLMQQLLTGKRRLPGFAPTESP